MAFEKPPFPGREISGFQAAHGHAPQFSHGMSRAFAQAFHQMLPPFAQSQPDAKAPSPFPRCRQIIRRAMGYRDLWLLDAYQGGLGKDEQITLKE